jgi:ABC-type glycerol-3-phosphate transport system substrate-binding protein
MNKNKIILLTLLIFSLFSLIPVNGETEAVNIDFWYITPDFENDNTLLSLIEDFETSEGVTVSTTSFSYDEAKAAFKTASFDGSSPDLFLGDAMWIPELVTNGFIEPIAKADLETEFMPKALRAVSYYEIVNDVINVNNITYYGFPLSVDTQAFLYSQSKVDSKGVTIPAIDGSWTPTEFKAAITRLNDQSNPADKKYGFSFVNMPDGAEALFYGNGGLKFSNYTVDQGHIAIESESSKSALQFMYDIVQTNRLTPEYKDQNSTNTYSHFAEIGDVASTFDYAFRIKKYLEGSQFSSVSNLGIAPIPLASNGTGGPLFVTSLMVSSGSSTDEQATALDLAQALTSESALVANAKDEYILPSSWKAFDHADLADNQIIQDFKIALENAREQPISKFWTLVREVFSGELKEMLGGLQNGSIAARAIGIGWSFVLPASVASPIPPVGDDVPISNGTPAASILFIVFALGVSAMMIRRKR